MVLPSLLKLLNVFLRQSTFTKAAAADHCCCPAALMPRPPGLPLSCRRGWEAREHPRRLPAEGREVRQRGATEVTKTRSGEVKRGRTKCRI
ncbi:potassium voltage-gated channel subfamily H member 2-like protein [Lates japonicus]|uniref:Potassium voltage-gated channel subfamily H member 2-like protein n=1 Tax=Lates japonicus TaxID=270547 RepID=A0AAD3NL74_LATJO|nr:potassium voltage-gated channel subfamily H member 2-like protein [Lates japonicus]